MNLFFDRLGVMKKLLGIIILGLFLITPSQADDIRDFQIEGMSIGDSLLDYMSEEEIKKNEIIDVYKDNKFILSLNNKSSENYDEITIAYKSKDKKYKIYGMSGIIDFGNDIKGCYKKQKEIEESLTSLFDKLGRKHWGVLKLNVEGDGSTYKPITYDIDDGGRLSNACYHYADDPQIDHLKMSLYSKEYRNYISFEAVEDKN